MPTPERPSPRTVSEFANDPEMAELVQLFVSEMPARIEALRAAWTQKQLVNLTRLSHQLKGASAGYGFPTIGNAAARLETALKGLDSGPSDVEKLAAEFRELVDLCASACARS